MRTHLIENNTRFFVKKVLNNCIELRNTYYYYFINISLLLGFLLIVYVLLYSKYKGKPTKKEQKEKDMNTYKYILSKIKNYQTMKRKAEQELITGLPNWDNEYDLLHKKI